jgi:hypothetical protein
MSDTTDQSSNSILERTAINMLKDKIKDKIDIKFISSVTGLSVDQLLKLKNSNC